LSRKIKIPYINALKVRLNNTVVFTKCDIERMTRKRHDKFGCCRSFVAHVAALLERNILKLVSSKRSFTKQEFEFPLTV
jgi:hypothetical protein